MDNKSCIIRVGDASHSNLRCRTVFGERRIEAPVERRTMAKTRESSSLIEQKTGVTKNQPTQEQIALRAYHIYLERGGVPGYELEDWTEAERQLVGENGKPRRKPTAKTAAA
jgi:hypothetical protein